MVVFGFVTTAAIEFFMQNIEYFFIPIDIYYETLYIIYNNFFLNAMIIHIEY